MQLSNEFVLKAPRPAVWAAMTDPQVAVACMPGAALTEQLPDGAFKATVSLKVGPVKLQFAGEGSLSNLSADGLYGEMLAKGSDSKGRGGFKTEMKFHLTPVEQTTKVRVDTELSLTGSVAQYGRGAGVVKEVASQLTQEFTRNLEAYVIAQGATSLASEPAQGLGAAATNDASSAGATTPPPANTTSTPINLPSLVLKAIGRWLQSLFRKH